MMVCGEAKRVVDSERRLTSIVITIEARAGAALHSPWDEPAPRPAGARLSRFRQIAQAASGDDLLLVIAGCIHLSMAVTVDLQQTRNRLVLCVDPQRQVFQCTARLHSLSSDELASLKLLQVAARAGVHEPVRVETRDFEAPDRPLPPLLWTLAMHGSRSALLPGLSESARYAIAPQWSRTGIPIDRTLLSVLDSMRLTPWTLPQLAARPELGGPRAKRLLNALQLLCALDTRVSGPSAPRHSIRPRAEAFT